MDSSYGSCGNAPVGFTLSLRKLIEREEATRVTDTGSSGGAGPAGAGRESGAGGICNVVLVGHSGSGKTTLAEALLARAGAINRVGRVEDGTTASDTEPEEQEKKHSLHMAVVSSLWHDELWTFLDSPGYPEFVAETNGALFGADLVVGVKVRASGKDTPSTK